MIFRHVSLDRELNFSNFGNIIIESPEFFRKFIQDLSSDKNEHQFSFTANSKVDTSLNYDFITNPCELNFNNKKVLSSLLDRLSTAIVSENFYLDFNELVTKLQKIISTAIDEQQFSFDVSLGNPAPSAIVKIFSPQIENPTEDFVLNLYQYLEIMTELTDTKIFIFLGLSSFLDISELNDLISFCDAREISLLSIESSDRFTNKISCPKLIIDADFCIL